MLTKEEKAWVRRVQKALDSCPSDRIGFYTVGDREVTLYDRSKEAEIHAMMDRGEASDFGPAVDKCDADLIASLSFPAMVHSVAG